MIRFVLSGSFACAERMSVHPLFGVAPEPVHIRVKLAAINPPDAAAPDFYSGQLIRADQGVDLPDADCEIGRNVIEGEKTGLDGGPSLFRGSDSAVLHTARIALIPIFTWFCARLWLFEGPLVTSAVGEVLASTSLRHAV